MEGGKGKGEVLVVFCFEDGERVRNFKVGVFGCGEEMDV